MELKAWLSTADKVRTPRKVQGMALSACYLAKTSWQSWSTALYRHTNKLQLPFTRLTEEFKVTSVRGVLPYTDFIDRHQNLLCRHQLELEDSGGHKRQLSREKQG